MIECNKCVRTLLDKGERGYCPGLPKERLTLSSYCKYCEEAERDLGKEKFISLKSKVK